MNDKNVNILRSDYLVDFFKPSNTSYTTMPGNIIDIVLQLSIKNFIIMPSSCNLYAVLLRCNYITHANLLPLRGSIVHCVEWRW